MESSFFARLFFRIKTINESSFLSILVILLSCYWLLFHWPSLNYYWNNDDLHLIRKFTTAELTQVFNATWDVELIETPGFRPFTVFFNHFRYVVIGESPANHRLLLLALMSSLLWIVGWIGFQLGLKRGPVALALLILVSTKAFAGDIIWVADGIHVFQNWLIAIAIVAMLRFVRYQSMPSSLLSLFFVWVAIWTREDSLVALMIMPIFFIVHYCQINKISLFSGGMTLQLSKISLNKKYAAYFIALYGIAILSLIYRKIYVPETSAMSASSSLAGIVSHIRMSMWIVGSYLSKELLNLQPPYTQTGSLLLNVITISWGIVLGTVLLFYLRTISKFGSLDRRVSVCLVCMIFTCTPGFVVVRSNLLFLPTLFFAFIIAFTVIEMWEVASNTLQNYSILSINRSNKSYNMIHFCVVFICLLAIIGSLKRATIQRLDMHPLSINQIERNRIFLGNRNAKIPSERFNYLVDEYSNLGMGPQTSAIELLNNVRKELYITSNGEKLFVPESTYLAP